MEYPITNKHAAIGHTTAKLASEYSYRIQARRGISKRCLLPPPKNQTEERDKFFGHRVWHRLAVSAVLGSRIDTPAALPPKIQFFWGEICPPEFLLPSSRRRLFWAPFFRARPHARGAVPASARHKRTTTFTSHLSLTSKSSKILCGGMLQ